MTGSQLTVPLGHGPRPHATPSGIRTPAGFAVGAAVTPPGHLIARRPLTAAPACLDHTPLRPRRARADEVSTAGR
ncbi:hypothetical protein [Micromonospora sp. NPDC049282]|uniref:hypothetical protein n=1 Tax=Micromonospora sp. NPDC049282 TaxID=3364269 RepID=UPI00371B0187